YITESTITTVTIQAHDIVEVLIDESLPVSFSLEQNFPNPFNSQTQIRYSIPNESDVRMDIYDILGKRIETLIDKRQRPGTYSIDWDASEYSSGVYFYKLTTGDSSSTKRMTLVK
ncbi:MAG: T9SS type A sorting domain-containing protein, partial [candidate division Zixibacteria bacterium]|nr:T9SS type A sorting domain-containing protein [candidate division Zixibacteria bacterium]